MVSAVLEALPALLLGDAPLLLLFNVELPELLVELGEDTLAELVSDGVVELPRVELFMLEPL